MPYLERKLMEDLIAWKNRSDRKPLVLKGARQVGKTRLLHEFGMREYADVATLNCDKSPAARTLFEQDFDMVRIIRGISAITGKEIQPEKTLIILDEIQEVPRALQSLKYFCEDAPNYHVCAAGSLLGIKIRGEYSYPVGKVHELTLYPMNFREFVHAIEGTTVYSALQQGKPEELSAIGDKWIELLRQYYYTGGMPEVVHSYITEKSLGKVRELQNQILHDYHDDISKHTDQRTAIRIHQILESIPSQLARENKKFVYGHIQKGARAKDFELALQWLIDAGLVYKISRVTKATIPLKFYEDSEAFKLYFLDCGLMGAITEAPASQTLIGNNIFQEYKGAFTEQYVLEELLSFHHNKIYYYHPEASQQEVDFLTQMNDAVCGIEVKAEENLKAKSLKLFSEQYPEAIAVRFSMSGYRKQEWMTNYPLYLVPRIETAGTDRFRS